MCPEICASSLMGTVYLISTPLFFLVDQSVTLFYKFYVFDGMAGFFGWGTGRKHL